MFVSFFDALRCVDDKTRCCASVVTVGSVTDSWLTASVTMISRPLKARPSQQSQPQLQAQRPPRQRRRRPTSNHTAAPNAPDVHQNPMERAAIARQRSSLNPSKATVDAVRRTLNRRVEAEMERQAAFQRILERQERVRARGTTPSGGSVVVVRGGESTTTTGQRAQSAPLSHQHNDCDRDRAGHSR